MWLLLALGCLKPSATASSEPPALPVAPDPLLVADTEAVRDAQSRKFADGCVTVDDRVLVLDDPSSFFGGRNLGIDLSTGATLWEASGELVQCHATGVVLADTGGASIVDASTGEVLARHEIAVPTPEGAECRRLSVAAWPGDEALGYAFLRYPSVATGARPGPEWEERTRCCVTGRITFDGGSASVEVNHTTSGRNVQCRTVDFAVQPTSVVVPVPEGFDAQAQVTSFSLPGGSVQLFSESGSRLVRFDDQGAVVWSRTFSQPEPPP